MANTKTKSAPMKRPRRASQRIVMSIDLAEDSLRKLMTEQCRNGSDYITVYHGSRAELVAAGVPEAAFPKEDIAAEFQVQTLNACCTGSDELLRGSMRSTADGFELEIDWGGVMPYTQGSHPAINELARMLLKDVLYWTQGAIWSDAPDLARPMDMLAADERSDYKPGPGAPRLLVTAEFHKELSAAASYLYALVFRNCEVLPSMDTVVKHPPRPSFVRLIVDNDAGAFHA
jgi:hypothetical protein